MTKTLKDFLEVYKPKSPDEQKFVDKHVTIKHKDRNGNGDDVFKGNTEYIKRKEERHGYDVGEDEKVYEETEIPLSHRNKREVSHYRVLNNGRDVTRHDSYEEANEYAKKHRAKLKKDGYRSDQVTVHAYVKEEVEELDERNKENKLKKDIQVVKAGQKEVARGINFAKYQSGVLADRKGHDYGIASRDDEDGEFGGHASRKTAIRTYKVAGRKAMKEDVENVEEARVYPGDYHVTSEKSQFGGHRPKVVHKEKGHTMYLGQHAYKKPAMAVKHGEAYLTAYAARGDNAAQNASMDFARANKKHLYVKEDIDIEAVLDEALDMLMSIDEKTLTPAEMKKREEVVKAIKRGNPKMDKSMAYAIATKTAKRVAEGVVPTADEPSDHDKKMAQKVRDLLAKEKKPVKEEQIDEISTKKLSDYTAAASDARRHRGMPTAKLDKRYKGVMRAGDKINKGFSKVHATEEVEDLEELSKGTLASYAKKAANQSFGKGVAGGAALASSDKETEAQGHKLVTKAAKRMTGVQKAIGKLTKEDIINRTIDKYVPEEMKFTPEERLLKRLEGLSESHVNTLFGLFEQLNSDNQTKMLHTCETIEGINSLLDFALQNRGE